jgi:serine/threonine protein phosphatase 1
MKKRTFVMGDGHGAYLAFKQCLDRSGFDYENDELISLGDIADGWPQVREFFDELLKIKNLTFILGNHDQWLLFWAKGVHPGNVWTSQGGLNTQLSYGYVSQNVPKEHIKLLEEDSKLWMVDDANRLFVHGGINWQVPIENQKIDVCLWDRSLVQTAYKYTARKATRHKMTEFHEVFVGHTTTSFFNSKAGPDQVPLNFFEIWMMDTGAGWEGKLTMMDIDTKEIFQSDLVTDLYPGVKGRR